jgi:hypothetical protein
MPHTCVGKATFIRSDESEQFAQKVAAELAEHE